MHLAHETQHHGDGDIGMAETLSRPISALALGAIGFEDREGTCDLLAATPGPDVGYLLMQSLLVKQADGLVGKARGQGGNIQGLMPLWLRARKQHAIGRHQTIEII
jgi:hypothetical protein